MKLKILNQLVVVSWTIVSPITAVELGLLSTASAQSSEPTNTNMADNAELSAVTTEGVNGDTDKKKRNPVISYQTVYEGSTIKLLVDGFVPNPDFQKYPLQFDFFVNRRLFSSQIRSSQQPGAVGVDIGPDIAVPPFNISITAKVLHPNSLYLSVAEGQVLPRKSSSDLNCELLITAGGESVSKDYFDDSIVLQDGGSGSIAFTFDGTDSTGTSIIAPVALTNSGGMASGTISIASTSIPLSGSVTESGASETQTTAKISAINLTSEDGLNVLNCSPDLTRPASPVPVTEIPSENDGDEDQGAGDPENSDPAAESNLSLLGRLFSKIK